MASNAVNPYYAFANPGIGFSNTNDPNKLAQNQRALVQQRGDQLESENEQLGQSAQGSANNYQGFLDPIQQQEALGNGGFNAAQTAGILQQPGLDALPTSQGALDSNFLTSDEQAGIQGNTGSYTDYFSPNAMDAELATKQGEQLNAANGLQQGLQSAIDPSQLKQSQDYLDTTSGQLQSNASGVTGALNTEGSNVRGAIDPNALTQDATAAQHEQMTPEQQQQIVTGAGISAGVQNQAAVGTLQRQAAAAGSSPLGVAAYRARMNQQTAAQAGDAMTQARVAAQQASASEALSSEQQREQAEQYLTGQQTGAELSLGQQNAAAQQALGTQALGQENTQEAQRTADEQYLTGANLQAATTGGEAQLQNAQTATSQLQNQNQYDASTGTAIREAQDQANSTRAGQVATNRQTTGEANQGTAFSQGNTVNQESSARNTTVANQQQATQQAGIQGQQTAQGEQNTNAQNAYGRQEQNYGTQSGATNSAANTGLAASQTPSTFDKVAGGVLGAAGAAASFLEDGAVVTKPEVHVIGENGPEMVVPAGSPYRARPKAQQMQQQKPAAPKRKFYGEAA